MTSGLEYLPTSLDRYSMGCVAHKLLPCSKDPVAVAVPMLVEQSSAAAVGLLYTPIHFLQVQRGCRVNPT